MTTVSSASSAEAQRPTLGGTWRAEPASSTVVGQVMTVWRHRSLYYPLVIRAVRDVYRKAVLGIIWMIIKPLMIAVPAIFVIGNVFNVSVDPLPLPLFILSGMAVWVLVRRCLQWFTKSMSRNRAILRRMYVPALLLLLTSAAPAVVEFLVVLGVVVGLAGYYAITGVYVVDIGLHTLATIPAVSMCVLLALAMGCFTSILNALIPDTWLTMRYTLSLWMVATPIVYPIDVIPERYRWLAYLNPLTPTVELFRWGALGYGTVRWEFVGLAVVEILALLYLGLWFFGKQLNRLFDHL